MPGQKFVTKERITVRNLRIREDTAKVGIFDTLHADKKFQQTTFCYIFPRK